MTGVYRTVDTIGMAVIYSNYYHNPRVMAGKIDFIGNTPDYWR